MNCNWSVKKLGDLVKFTSGGTPSKSNEAYWGGDIPWISASSMDSTRYSESDLKVTTEGSKNGTRLVPKDTVLLLVRGGALHNKIPVGITTREVTFNQDVKALVPKTDEITPWYLLFWLISIKKTLLAKVENTGIGAGKLDTKILQELEVPLPPQSELKRLEKFCKALDDKIILNTDTNQTLEAMAQAIFKSWFVDFEPVKAKMNGEQPEGMDAATASLFPEKLVESELGMIPDGWEVKPLDKIAHFENGLALQKFRPESEDDEFLPVLKIAQLRQGYCDGKEKARTDIKESCRVYNGDMIFSWSGTLMIDLWTGGKAALNQHLFKVTSKDYTLPLYLYWTKHHLVKFQQIAKDKAVTMGHIKRGHLSESLCVVPPKDLRDKMDEILMPLINQGLNMRLQSNQLATLRDTLLPKLLSGEIELGRYEDIVN